MSVTFSQIWSCKIHIPAAAAGSVAKAFGPLLSAVPGLRDLLAANGLLLLCVSDSRLEGERDRRSNREDRFGSGSVWSNRERFELLRSSSAIANEFLMKISYWYLQYSNISGIKGESKDLIKKERAAASSLPAARLRS